GVDATRESGEMLQGILENVESISSINEQIAAATHEQTATFNDVV
ncbi:MAG: methyl-accepting chemotaxis protein, partial [Anaerolineae bacterium]|nr:methyl-accepting chemotaxis protein [Anaerolineae bacterium]